MINIVFIYSNDNKQKKALPIEEYIFEHFLQYFFTPIIVYTYIDSE